MLKTLRLLALLTLLFAAVLCGCNKDAATDAASPSPDAAQATPGTAAPGGAPEGATVPTRTKAGPVGAPR